MKNQQSLAWIKGILQISCILLFQLATLSAQQTKITNFVLFGGSQPFSGQTVPAAPGYGVQLGSSTTIQGGSIGSYSLIKTTGNVTITGNIYSGGTVNLSNSNSVTGRIAARNFGSISNVNILTIGSNAIVGGNIDVNGNILIGGGTISGIVTHPVGTLYSGPDIGVRNVEGIPSLPDLPQMPIVTNFPSAGITNLVNTQTITPGAYGNITLTGNKTITFSGVGVYVFNSIKNSGTTNDFVYDFKNNTTGSIKIYVHGDVDLNKVKASTINGGSATKIYCEVHGNGGTSTDGKVTFNIANGSAGQASKWIGSVWAPFATITIGSGTGSTDITGALWSGTQINIQGGGVINYEPFTDLCLAIATANAGPDKPLEFGNLTTLIGTSSSSDASFSWNTTNGGVISSPVNSNAISVSAAGTYILTVKSSGTCDGTDTAVVTGKLNNLIGSELESIYKNGTTTSPFFILQEGKIMIDVIVKSNQYNNALSTLTSTYGFVNTFSNGASTLILTGWIPINNLLSLNNLNALIVYCRPYFSGVSNLGVVHTAGDSAIKSHLVRGGYRLSGEGVKIGVISDSYNTITAATSNPITNTAAQDINNDDLPTNGVTLLQDAPFKRSDEGRAMLQIIHDIAPKAQLFFRTGFNTPGDMAIGIEELRNAGCNAIVDDVTFISEPFLKDGVIATAVNNVVSAGTTYISAAGNFSNKSYENFFNAITAPGGLQGKAHNFGNGDAFQSINLAPGNYTIVLQWEDNIYSLGQSGTLNDLDIYLTPNTNGTALFGFNRNNINGDPTEFIHVSVPTAMSSNILIINNSLNPSPLRFKYIVFKGSITINEYNTGTSTIVGQSNALGAIAVGAARYDKVSPNPGPLVIESFSSIGGTMINNSVRQKPDLVGPDGVNTTVNLGIDYDNNGYSNFFGTSAAAPHIAAITALIMEGRKKYLNQSTSAPSTIKSILQNTAIDMSTPGFDYTSGYGFANADAALRSFALPKPAIDGLDIPIGVVPGTATFNLTVKGQYFSPSSVLYYRNTPLVTTVQNTQQATVVMPLFTGNPALRIYTAPISSSQLDGGWSDSIFFFNTIKKNIQITADAKIKKFGQQLPTFTASILVDGVPLSQSGLTISNLGLATMSFLTTTSSSSDVGTYIITPSRPFLPGNPADIGLLELYNYSFNTGTITIEKLPVTITASSMNAVYRSKINPIQFTYQFDPTGIADPVSFLNTIRSIHQLSLAKDGSGNDILGLVNSTPLAIVNGVIVPIVNGIVSIVNGQTVTIVNGVGVPIVNAQSLNIVNGQITGVNELVLNSEQIQNLSFLISTNALQTTRKLINKKLVNGIYVNDSTSIIDIAQESILDFNTNSAQTYLLHVTSQSNAKGLVDLESYTNGSAVTITNAVNIVNGVVNIVNGVVNIVNGATVSIVNGATVVIVNGVAVTITNSGTVPIVNGSNRSAVIFGENEIGTGIRSLKSINLLTGLGVGTQRIIPGAFVNNNFEVNHVPGVLNISPAPLTIKPNIGQNKIFNTGDPILNYTDDVGLPATDFTGSLSRIPGENVGNYMYTLGTLSAGPNYNLILSNAAPLATFSITPKLVSITPNDGQQKSYGSVDPIFSFTNSASISSFTGALGRVNGEQVGSYAYTLGNLSAGINYTLSISGNVNFQITKVPLTVKANDQFIYKGDPLPVFNAMITGLKNGDNPVVSYILTPPYLGLAGEYAIQPTIAASFQNNYVITYIGGTLYVNPRGPGAKKLRSALDCVIEQVNPIAGQFKYIAKFVCFNDNATTVYVPIGPDNKLTSLGGSFDGSKQPQVFKSGMTNFDVPFDGNKLTWVLATFETSHKTSVATEASSGSKKCNNLNQNESSLKFYNKSAIGSVIYPNPGSYKIMLETKRDIIGEVHIFDLNGRLMEVGVINHISNNRKEMDLSTFSTGYYIIRINSIEGSESIPFIKH